MSVSTQARQVFLIPVTEALGYLYIKNASFSPQTSELVVFFNFTDGIFFLSSATLISHLPTTKLRPGKPQQKQSRHHALF